MKPFRTASVAGSPLRAILLAVLLVTNILPVVAVAENWEGCVVVADPNSVFLPALNTHVRQYNGPQGKVVETWEETNGHAGLQETVSMACGGSPDTYRDAHCLGARCPLPTVP